MWSALSSMLFFTIACPIRRAFQCVFKIKQICNIRSITLFTVVQSCVPLLALGDLQAQHTALKLQNCTKVVAVMRQKLLTGAGALLAAGLWSSCGVVWVRGPGDDVLLPDIGKRGGGAGELATMPASGLICAMSWTREPEREREKFKK